MLKTRFIKNCSLKTLFFHRITTDQDLEQEIRSSKQKTLRHKSLAAIKTLRALPLSADAIPKTGSCQRIALTVCIRIKTIYHFVSPMLTVVCSGTGCKGSTSYNFWTCTRYRNNPSCSTRVACGCVTPKQHSVAWRLKLAHRDTHNLVALLLHGMWRVVYTMCVLTLVHIFTHCNADTVTRLM